MVEQACGICDGQKWANVGQINLELCKLVHVVSPNDVGAIRENLPNFDKRCAHTGERLADLDGIRLHLCLVVRAHLRRQQSKR